MTESSKSSPRSRPKGDKRERTRAKLLEATRSLIREKGYDGVTLEQIAERAGMTTGAIYGNFKDRDDLFIAVAQKYWSPIKPRVKPGATFPDVMRAMAKATIEAIPERAAVAVGRLTGLAYTLTHEEHRARVALVTAESYAFGEEWLREVLGKEDLPIPAGQLVRILHALTEGLVFQRLLTPELVPDQLIPSGLHGAGKPATLDLASPGMEYLVLDQDSAAGVRYAAEQLQRRFPELNVLINNAGIQQVEDLTSGEIADAEATINTNLLGPIRITAALIQRLIIQPQSVIRNVSSTLALVAAAMLPTYCAI